MSTHELNFSSSDFGNLAKLNLNLIQLTNQLCDLQLTEIITSLQERHPNPFCRFGRKGFSQTDEDGLTFEIYKNTVLPKILEIIVICKDTLAQQYLMECVI